MSTWKIKTARTYCLWSGNGRLVGASALSEEGVAGQGALDATGPWCLLGPIPGFWCLDSGNSEGPRRLGWLLPFWSAFSCLAASWYPQKNHSCSWLWTVSVSLEVSQGRWVHLCTAPSTEGWDVGTWRSPRISVVASRLSRTLVSRWVIPPGERRERREDKCYLSGNLENPEPQMYFKRDTPRGCGEKGTLLHCWWECKLVQPLWRIVWRFLRKLKIELPYDPAIPLLGIHPDKTLIQKDTCTPYAHSSSIHNSQDMETT